MQRKIKILYFIPGFYFGGIESLVLKICQLINKERFQIDILKHSNNPDDTELLLNLKEIGCNVYNLPKFRILSIFTYIRACKDFICRTDYDIIQSHSLTYSFFLFFYSRNKIKIRILHSHTSRTDGVLLKKIFFNLMKCGVRHFATDCFSCSDLATLWGFGRKENVRIIKNGIDTKLFSYDDKFRTEERNRLKITDTFVIGHVGRVTKPKNLLFVLKIFNEILKINESSRLIQIGDGPDIQKVKDYATQLGICDKILFLGRKDNVSKYYSLFDVFLFPSLWEGFPLSVVEAQTSGLPCFLSSQITKDVKILDNCVFMGLDKSASEWAYSVLNYKKVDRSKALYDVIASGFDIETSVNDLEDYYLNRISDENIKSN